MPTCGGGIGSKLRIDAGVHLSSLARTLLCAALPTVSTHPVSAMRNTGSGLRRDACIHLSPLALLGQSVRVQLKLETLSLVIPFTVIAQSKLEALSLVISYNENAQLKLETLSLVEPFAVAALSTLEML